jgi:predicted ribosomally synthesized peptide with nif11-like leader
MAQEALMKFVRAVETDGALKSELLAASTPEQKSAVAVKHGYSISTQDLKELSASAGNFSEGEISDAELAAVGGGTIQDILRSVKKTGSDVWKALFG